MGILHSVAPIVLTITVGYLIAASRLLDKSGWQGVELLSFRVLIPAMLIKAIATSDQNLSAAADMVTIVVAALVLAAFATFSLRWLQGRAALPNRSFTTLFQTTIRWNAFIALAAVELLVGPIGTTMVSLSMVVLIPLINIASIVVLAAYGTAKASPTRILIQIARNPLILGCFAGIAIKMSALDLPGSLFQTLDFIGRAALGVGLLAVGAGISLTRLIGANRFVWLGVGLRQILCPALFLAVASWFGLGFAPMMVGAIIVAVPAAANGYIVTKHMGGDADLYADVLTWQTLLSIPVLVLLGALVPMLAAT